MDDSTKRSSPGPCPPTNDYHAYNDPNGTAKLSTAVTHALADVMGRDVTEAGFVLFDTIDPDALDRLFSPSCESDGRSPGHVAFTVDDHKVTVYSTGEIVVTPPSGPDPSSPTPP